MTTARYPALTSHNLPVGANHTRPRQYCPDRLTLDSPAVEGMTDLRMLTAPSGCESCQQP